jgi:hypothetical protein
VAEESIPQTLKRLERYIHNLQAARSLNTLKRDARDAVLELREAISNARSTYTEVDEDDAFETIKATELSIDYLKQVEQLILKVSSYDLLGAVDVAELSALTEHLRERLHTRISQ